MELIRSHTITGFDLTKGSETVCMGNVTRITKYLWPYRYTFFLSVVCAIGIAVCWCANLSAVGPVVKILFENDSVHQFVDNEIVQANETIARETVYLAEAVPAGDLTKRVKIQARLADATATLKTYTNVKTYILPYVPVDRFKTVSLILGFVFAGTLLKCFFIYAQEVLVGRVMTLAANDIRMDCFRNALKLDLQTVSKAGTSGLLSRMTNDIQMLTMAISAFGTRLIREPLKALACIGAAFYINWRLTLMAVMVVPLIGFFLAKFGRSLKKAGKSALQSIETIYSSVSETFESFKVVSAFSGQRRQRKQFLKANREFYTHTMKCVRMNSLIRPTSELMGVMVVMVAFAPGVYMVLEQTDTIFGIQLAPEAMTITELMTLYVLLAGVLDPVRKLSTVFGQIKLGMASADRVFGLIARKSLVHEPEVARKMVRHSKSICFKDVSFRYQTSAGNEARPLALDKVNLTFNFGEVVAIVGGNGSGKSTLLSLLPRFMDPESGAILVDDVRIQEYRTMDLRRQIGLVSQETMLFDDSIYENIRYGNFEADREAIENAARQAHAWDFITQLPEGFDTQIGPGGGRLSGGQRQRISLARAIVRDPSILILDEATSAVDAQSEDLIHRVLKTFSKGRTVFIITHALSGTFLDLVDRIVVMEQGTVVAIGTHAELLGKCPQYQRLSQAGTGSAAA
jgi:subfamily B ATP-binding cassette protein MsbA